MRNQCRLLLLFRSYRRSPPHISNLSHAQVQSLRSISSSLQSCSTTSYVPLYQSRTLRFYSSSEQLAMEPPKDSSDQNQNQNQIVALTDIFSQREITNQKVKLGLEANNIVITHDLVLSALKNLQPDVARKFVRWICRFGDDEQKILSSKSCNLMLCVLLGTGFPNDFWEMVSIMKRKGYGVSKGVFVKALEKFEKDGWSGDVLRLKALNASGSTDNSVEDLSYLLLCKIISVLASQDSTVKFWRVVDEMKKIGFEMDKDMYVETLEIFVKKRMIKDAVDLYELAMGWATKPSPGDCTYLLKEIAVSKELDMDLFLRVVRISREKGHILTNSTFKAVLKSLTSAGRFEECNKILKAVKADFEPNNSSLQSRIAFQLSSDGKSEEADEFIEEMEESEHGLGSKGEAQKEAAK